MPIPDSPFAARARELVLEAEPGFLVNHSIRAYAWAVALADHNRLAFDPEILYAAALLHDIGLVPAYDLGGCFELDGAIAARDFAIGQGEVAERADAIRHVIVRHMAAQQPPDATAEDVLLDQSTGVDVTGYRFGDIAPAIVSSVLAAYPRLDFKREFAALFVDQAARKPHCRVAEMVRTGKVAAIEAAPFPD
jgi:hypothetical protein